MTIAEFSIKQSVLINLLMLVLVMAGLMAYFTIPEENFPYIPFGMVTVTTINPDITSPDEVEKSLTVPIEQEVQTLEGIKRLLSWSFEGRSVILIETDDSVKDVFRFVQDVKQRIDPIKRDFPDDTEDPVIAELKHTIPAVTVTVSGDADWLALKQAYDRLKDDIRQIRGIGTLEETGIPDREIQMRVDPVRLYAYNLTMNDIVAAVRQKNMNLPAGEIDTARGELRIRTIGEITRAADLENVVIRARSDGAHVFLRDVAAVIDGFAKPASYSRVNGRRGLSFAVNKTETGNVIDLSRDVVERVRRFNASSPASIRAETTNDTSKFIINRLKTVKGNAWLGMILVFLMLMAMMDFVPAFWTAIGVPIALSITFAIMWNLFGMTTNLLTLFGMVMVLGMLVDDGIVVTENIYRYVERGMDPVAAAIRGTNEVFWPVLASVGTTVAAFFPMLFSEGILGKFLSFIPMVIIIALSGSLIECFLALPAHMAATARKPRGKNHTRYLRHVIDVYLHILKMIIRRRYLVIALLILGIAGTLMYAAMFMPFKLFNDDFDDSVFLLVETPRESSLDFTYDIMTRVEAAVYRTLRPEEILSLTTEAGKQFDQQGGFKLGDNLGWINVDLNESLPGIRPLEEIKRLLRRELANIPGIAGFSIEKPNGGPPVGSPVYIRVIGRDMDELRQVAGDVEAFVRTVPGVVDIANSFEEGKEEVQIEIQDDRAGLYGLNTLEAATAVSQAFLGGKADELRWEKDKIELIARLDTPYRRAVEDIGNYRIRNTQGNLVPLQDIATITARPGYHQIMHYNGLRNITISGNVDASTTSAKANEIIRGQFIDFERQHPGYHLAYGGEEEDTQRSMASILRGFLISFFLVYTIIAGVFRSYLQPLIIITAVPMAFVGAIIGLMISNQPIGLLPLMGCIALTGIVVNDSIVFVDFVQSARRAGANIRKAVLAAARTRLRPIILTSVTTMGGVWGLAYGQTGQERLLAPMAITIFWGLLSSTLLILLIVPCFYVVLDDWSRLWKRRSTKVSDSANSPL